VRLVRSISAGVNYGARRCVVSLYTINPNPERPMMELMLFLLVLIIATVTVGRALPKFEPLRVRIAERTRRRARSW
jgi:hypothetical protein